MEGDTEGEILHIGFNQDAVWFTVGTDNGFRIFNWDPFKNTFSREFDGGISIVSMLFRWNILAIVGGGSNPKYNPDKVMLWDDNQSKCIGELKFKNNVKGVKMNKEMITVILDNRIYVYEFSNLKIKDAIETYENNEGLWWLSAQKGSSVLAVPDKDKGHVRVNLYDKNLTKTIEAHDGEIAWMALNKDGSLLATASDKGTLIRVFDTETTEKVREFRRGADNAKIYSIAFDFDDSMLAVSSDKGTVHVFDMGDLAESQARKEDEDKNTKSVFSFMKGVLPKYFASEWSFAQFNFAEDSKPMHTICAFTQEKKLVLVSMKGDYYLLDVNKEDKEITKTVHSKINEE